jgi:ADP-ribose pyrophosphatase YjhB (NUDIX family)
MHSITLVPVLYNEYMDSILHSVLVNGVVFRDGQVLVSQRSMDEKHMPGKWTVPGGKIERTDGDVFQIVEKTLARETGVEIEEQVALVTNNTFIRSSNDQHVIVLVFKCIYKSGEAQPLEDTIDCKWVSIEEVKTMEFPPNVQGYILKAYEI